jgi:hypothetical protein
VGCGAGEAAWLKSPSPKIQNPKKPKNPSTKLQKTVPSYRVCSGVSAPHLFSPVDFWHLNLRSMSGLRASLHHSSTPLLQHSSA